VERHGLDPERAAPQGSHRLIASARTPTARPTRGGPSAFVGVGAAGGQIPNFSLPPRSTGIDAPVIPAPASLHR
jgi:hypothetical protein